MNIILFGEPK